MRRQSDPRAGQLADRPDDFARQADDAYVVGEAASEGPQPPRRPGRAPALSPVEFARWIWRQLTSMRTALILLFLLALAAIPGSVVPQEAVDSVRAGQWRQDHPT